MPEQGDVQLNLTPKSDRDRSSHEIALDLRERLAALDLPAGTSLKVVEPPPGPPVMATLLAEIYGPDAEDPPAGGGQGARGFPGRALRRRYRQFLRHPGAQAARHGLDR